MIATPTRPTRENTVSADRAVTTAAPAPTSGATPPAAPVSERAAFAVLGSMILLIVALVVLLIQTTWVDPASATEAPPVAADGGSFALR
jgi:hypothetical protein